MAGAQTAKAQNNGVINYCIYLEINTNSQLIQAAAEDFIVSRSTNFVSKEAEYNISKTVIVDSGTFYTAELTVRVEDSSLYDDILKKLQTYLAAQSSKIESGSLRKHTCYSYVNKPCVETIIWQK